MSHKLYVVVGTSSFSRRPRKLAGGLGGQGREAKAPKKKKGQAATVTLPAPVDDRYDRYIPVFLPPRTVPSYEKSVHVSAPVLHRF